MLTSCSVSGALIFELALVADWGDAKVGNGDWYPLPSVRAFLRTVVARRNSAALVAARVLARVTLRPVAGSSSSSDPPSGAVESAPA